METKLTFLFAGGGTGGHLFPGISVAQELQKRKPATRSIFVGSTREIESTIVAERGLEHVMLPVEPLPTLKRNPFRFLWRNWQAFLQASRLLDELQPNAVIGLGGFASAPLVWAARRRRVPVILLEQNVIPGRTTRWLSRFASCVCVSFAETSARLPHSQRTIVTGNPVRAEIAALHSRSTTESGQCDQPAVQHELLILGGSQGADSMNDAVLAALRRTLDVFSEWKIVHQTGPRQADLVRSEYNNIGLSVVVEPFFHDMPRRYATASLVISRAGATTLAELACLGKAMILIPYPHATDHHQHENARAFVEGGAALMVEQSLKPEVTADQLAAALEQLARDAGQRTVMGLAAKVMALPDAANRIAQIVFDQINQ